MAEYIPTDTLPALALKLDSFTEASLLKPNPILDNAILHSEQNGLPAIAVTPLQGTHLAILARLMGAKSVLEIGTLGGYSTICFVQDGGVKHVTSIEWNTKHAKVATHNTKNFADKVEIINGSALDVLPKLHDQGRVFDLIFIDAAWTEQEQYFDWAVKMARQGGCIYLDNVVRAFLDGESNAIEAVGKDERVMATVVPTLTTRKRDLVGVSGYDGYLLAYVK